jgi:hypothetical protein
MNLNEVKVEYMISFIDAIFTEMVTLKQMVYHAFQ